MFEAESRVPLQIAPHSAAVDGAGSVLRGGSWVLRVRRVEETRPGAGVLFTSSVGVCFNHTPTRNVDPTMFQWFDLY